MKRKRTSISDLNTDVLKHVMVFLCKSSDGYANLARTTSVCKEFMELAGDKDLLRVVFFEETCVSRSDESFWKTDGLLTKCARAGSKSACYVLLKHVKEQVASIKIKRTAFDLSVKEFHERARAVKAVHTRARSRAAALAWEDVAHKVNDINMDNGVISQHIDAVEIGLLAWERWLEDTHRSVKSFAMISWCQKYIPSVTLL